MEVDNVINITPEKYGICEIFGGYFTIVVPNALDVLPKGVEFNFEHNGEIYKPIETNCHGYGIFENPLYFKCVKD